MPRTPFDDTSLLPEQAKPDPAAQFVKMAEQIQHNAASDFGGAFVVVPPDGEPLSALILTKDPAQFWMMVSAKIQFRLQEIERQETQAGAFGQRR